MQALRTVLGAQHFTRRAIVSSDILALGWIGDHPSRPLRRCRLQDQIPSRVSRPATSSVCSWTTRGAYGVAVAVGMDRSAMVTLLHWPFLVQSTVLQAFTCAASPQEARMHWLSRPRDKSGAGAGVGMASSVMETRAAALRRSASLLRHRRSCRCAQPQQPSSLPA